MTDIQPRIFYTRHAEDMLAERRIERAWVERTRVEPEEVQADAAEPDVWRAFRTIPERDGRVLRVVWRRTEDGAILAMTIYFDRSRKR